MNEVELEIVGETVARDRRRITDHVRGLQDSARDCLVMWREQDPAIALGFDAQLEVLQAVLDFIEAMP